MRQLSRTLKDYLGVKHVFADNNGMTRLIVTLEIHFSKPGSEASKVRPNKRINDAPIVPLATKTICSISVC